MRWVQIHSHERDPASTLATPTRPAKLVAAYLAEQQVDVHALPLDVRGTAFQARVWQALREIPAGQTRSYGEVALAIGQPSASRKPSVASSTSIAA